MSQAPVAPMDLAVGLPVGNQLFADDALHRIVELARMADDAGVTTLLVPDHVVMGDRVDRYLWGPFPQPIATPWLEPLTLLAFLAAATSRVQLATAILIAPLRPAALLGKTAATLDVLSQGRLELGVGTGWQEEEYLAEGLEFSARGQSLTDTVAACRVLWGPSPADFSSETISFSNIWCEPKPIQPGGPRVLFSGTLNRRNVERITTLGDGWIPIMGASNDDIASGVRVLRERWQAAGRDPSRLKVRAPLPVAQNTLGMPDLHATLDGTATLAALGVTEVIVRIGQFLRDPDEAPRWFEMLAESWAGLTV
jgi:probable F420-dependent oxidoreductase